MMRSASSTPTRWLGVCLIAFLSSGCATVTRFNAADTAAVDHLLGLIEERLNLAPDVARVKWNTHAPIEDLSREREVIEGVTRRATEYGLDSAIAGDFFRGQIEASKTVQNDLHVRWRALTQPRFADVADLDQDIRPALDRLTPMMLRALAEALPVIRQHGGGRLLDTRSRTMLARSPAGEIAVRQAITPLRQVSR